VDLNWVLSPSMMLAENEDVFACMYCEIPLRDA